MASNTDRLEPTGDSKALEQTTQEKVFHDLTADDAEQMPLDIESVCPSCKENGMTKLMLTSIPYYKAVVIMSFSCEHCGYHNNEIQSGEAVQEHGTEIVLRVCEQVDLRRQLVKSEYASIEIPELELEIPSQSQPGVEGVLMRVEEGLKQDQEKRRQQDPEGAAQLDNFIVRLRRCATLCDKWTLKLHDPTGNCFIQNPQPLHVDPRCITTHYHRSLEEKKLLALADDDAQEEEAAPEWKSFEDAKQEILHFSTECPNCGAPVETLMKPTDIPYFQTVIIMATTCDRCGLKSNEVKSAGAIREYGCRLSISVQEPVDLARDVLKSDTCGLSIPELDLEVGPGALSGRFTSVEGLLIATKEQLSSQTGFLVGDSASSDEKQQMRDFLAQFDDILSLKKPVTLILDDPAGNSYIQLGLNDMRTEGYELETVPEEEEEVTPAMEDLSLS